jgi:hypothetical protein
VTAVIDLSVWQAQFLDCPWQNCDLSGDGIVDGRDIGAFVELLIGY